MKVDFIKVLNIIKNNNGKVIRLKGKACIGKTYTSIKLVEHFSYNLNIPTVFFSLEMSKETVESKIKDLSNNLIIIDTPNISIQEICKNIRQLYIDKNVKFVVIDYIQLVSDKENKCLSFKEQQKKLLKS